MNSLRLHCCEGDGFCFVSPPQGLALGRKLTGEKISVKTPERRCATQLTGRNPSIGFIPLPTSDGSPLQPLPQIRYGHRINIDADILREKTRKRLQ